MKIFNANGQLISNINHKVLHNFILNRISQEFANLVENCYYPNIQEIYIELLHMTSTNEKALKEYSKQKYNHPERHLIHDPYTTLLVLIVQEFLNNKDLAAANATFHLFSLRYYRNLLYKYTTKASGGKKLCLPDVFQTALDQLSKNHLYSKQKTIANTIMYLSNKVFQRHLMNLKNDNAIGMEKMIMEIRHRINQSMRSFFNKYYEIVKNKDTTKSKDEEEHDTSHEVKVRSFVESIAKDICVYGNIKTNAVDKASQLLKFNKQLSVKYVQELSKYQYKDDVELALYLLIKDLTDMNMIKSLEFLDYLKKLLAIKITKQQIYFKKSITELHDKIIKNIGLQTWYSNLSIQSQSLSRNYIAYYLASYLQESV